MRVYVAGPMTGYPAYNVRAFREAASAWMQEGNTVETPFEANSRVWMRHFGQAFDPYLDTCDYGNPIIREMFAEDVSVLLASDAVAVLPGWEQSKGATLEARIALQFGIPVLKAEHPTGSAGRGVRAETGSLRPPTGQLCPHCGTPERVA